MFPGIARSSFCEGQYLNEDECAAFVKYYSQFEDKPVLVHHKTHVVCRFKIKKVTSSPAGHVGALRCPGELRLLVFVTTAL